jgi:Sensors of blue-light using FAD
MVMVRLIYFSEYRVDVARGTMISQLNAILGTANRSNQANGITGALVFDSEWFVQMLEGERDAVWSTFKRIERDNRHSNVMPAELTGIAERKFGRWWMGCAERNARNASSFARYLHDGRFRPNQMSADDLRALLIDLERSDLARELAA